MKISVITPSYNQGHFIKETIDSILSQDWDDIEYIVMDGGSTENTVEILESYGEQIIWKSEKDRGQTHAINKGLEIATGDVLCYLNSDDFFMPGVIRKVMEKFQSDEKIKWISGDYIIIDEKGKEIQSFVASYKRFLRSLPQKSTLEVANYIIQPSTFWRKEVYEEFGEFDEDLHLTMDYDYWLRIIQKYPLTNLDDALCSFRIHGDSKGGTIFDKQFAEELATAKKYGVGGIKYFLHWLHNKAIVSAYKIMK